MFTEEQKVSIRRFCGYPARGSSVSPVLPFTTWIYFSDLEYRMDNLKPEEEDLVITFYLPNLTQLESDIVATRSNLDIDRAAVYYRNKKELREREYLFDTTRLRLCEFLAVEPGRGLVRHLGFRLVV